MQAIWKFPIGTRDSKTASMPEGAKILCIQAQGGIPCIWALVETDAPLVERTFSTYGTGHHHIAIPGQYIGTYQLSGGMLVFHVFEETP